MLRTAFHIVTGFQEKDMPKVKYKSKMKQYYIKAGIPVARYHLVDTLQECNKFISEVGYPVIVKPDNGVGASRTYKLTNEQELLFFFETKVESISYIMEEFIHAEVNSYDAIINSKGEPIFETGNVTPVSIMDTVNDNLDSVYYIVKDLPDDIKAAGRATVKSFGVKSRFVHFEFFRLTQDQPSMGKKGDICALEVNMRPSGGFSPDMMNFANSTNVYKIWADMIVFDKSYYPSGEHFYCPFIGRRDEKNYALDEQAVHEKYGEHLKMVERILDALAGAMGNQMYLATFSTKEELDAFYRDLSQVAQE